MDAERRQFQRLHLTRPIDGWFGDFSVRLLDVSATGALVEHDEEVPLGSRALLRFFWRGQQVEITAETVRTANDEAGLHFVEDSELLRNLIAESARELLIAQQANADGAREFNVIGDETLTAASAGLRHDGGFFTYTLEEGAWKRRKSLLPDQPPNGFTIGAGEPAERIELLCATYQDGDEDARLMTRLLAELSAAAVK